jgi:hypothetical protein
MTDGDYRTAIEQNPKQLMEDYQLSRDDIQLMTQVREASRKEDPDVQGYAWDDEDWDEFWDIVSDCTCCC